MDSLELLSRLREAQRQAGGRPVEVEIHPLDGEPSLKPSLITDISYEPAPPAWQGHDCHPERPRIIITCRQ